MTENLKYISEEGLLKLLLSVEENVHRYRGDGFCDLAEESSWNLKLNGVKINTKLLDKLEVSSGKNRSNAEIKNSLLVYEAFEGMTPNLACEDRIWTRLTHLECFEYSKKRWIVDGTDDAKVCKAVKTHFFAPSQTRVRDDNAISRLWWNTHIAQSSFPGNPETALEVILKTADIRSNFIERSEISSRSCLAAGLVRIMSNESWITSAEDNFRQFMKTVNKYGGGVLFEVMTDDQMDHFMGECFRQSSLIHNDTLG